MPSASHHSASCSHCLQYYINDRTAILVDQQQLPADSGVAMEIDASRPRNGFDYYVSTPKKVCPIPTPSKPHFKHLLCTDSVHTPVALVLPLAVSNINTHMHTSTHPHIHTSTHPHIHTSTHPHMCTCAHEHTHQSYLSVTIALRVVGNRFISILTIHTVILKLHKTRSSFKLIVVKEIG